MKYYRYLGNPSCGCCEDICPSFEITRCNFNEYCNTSGGEWIETNYGTQARPNKKCELWYTQSATISIKSDKIKDYNSAEIACTPYLYYPGFHATPWDTKSSEGDEQNQTREDGDMFVETYTVEYGSHTVVCRITTEWIYNEDGDYYETEVNCIIYIDNIPCSCDYAYNSHWVLGEFRPGCNLSFFRNGNVMDVYIPPLTWVGSFPYSESHFSYTYHAEYTGTSKYLCVNPELTWSTVVNKPDCEWVPPGTALTQEQIAEIEERQRIERNRNCLSVVKDFAPHYSPPFEIQLSNVPSVHNSCIKTFRPITWVDNYPPIAKTSYYLNTDKARRLELDLYTNPVVQGAYYMLGAKSICKEVPYDYSIDFYLDVPHRLIGTSADFSISIVTAPQYGTATIYAETDNNSNVTRRGIRYTAPSSLPTGTCEDWLEYEVVGYYGEIYHRVIKLKLYNAEESQTETWAEDLKYGNDGGYSQQVWTLYINGKSVNENGYETGVNWHVYLYGLLPIGAKTYNDIGNVTFSYIDILPGGYDHAWVYSFDANDYYLTFTSDQPISSTDERYPQYLQAKSEMEAVTASINLNVSNRGNFFICDNNNILQSNSIRPIETTTSTVSMKLVKKRIRSVTTNDGVETTETVLDTLQLPSHTEVLDWGISPAENAFGTIVPQSPEWENLDISEYASHFNIDSFFINSIPWQVQVLVGGIKTDPESYEVWSGNADSGTTPAPDNFPWSTLEKIYFETETSTSITYF